MPFSPFVPPFTEAATLSALSLTLLSYPLLCRVSAFARRRARHPTRSVEDSLLPAKAAQSLLIFERSPSGLMLVDAAGKVVMANPALETALGYGRGEMAGLAVEALLPDRLREQHVAYRQDYARSPRVHTMGLGRDLLARCRDGREIEVEVGLSPIPSWAPGQVLCSIVDISERKRLERQLMQQAKVDSLTGLPNRSAAQAALEELFSGQSQAGQHCAVLFVDLDRFKDINDGWGHWTGDQVIKQAAMRLASCLHKGARVARLGGDEFVVIAEQLSSKREAVVLARSILQAMQLPAEVDGEVFTVQASIGISLHPDDGAESGTELLRNADAALYKAKHAGRGRFAFYSPELTRRAIQRAWIKAQLLEALRADSLQLALQPVLALGDGALLGYEALLRWQHPERGNIRPDEFIPITEHSQLIEMIGRRVLQLGCALAARLQVPVAVNVSAQQLRSKRFPEDVYLAITAAGLPSRLLQLEITEGAFLENYSQAISQLQALRSMGIKISVDDFGTGYSSLQYLKKLPIDCVKIDRSFVENLAEDGDSRAVVAAILSLARHFQLRTTAEGIETEAQLNCLREMGCDTGQGYLLGRPKIMGFESSDTAAINSAY